MTKSNRNNDYYLKRLEVEHPMIHADFLAGKYGTLADALQVSGLRKRRTRVHELLNAWDKATPSEREEFIERLWKSNPGVFAGPSTATPAVATTAPAFSNGRHLAPWAVARIQKIMLARRLKLGQVLVELGLGIKPLNPSLGLALHRGTTMQQPLIDALELWVAKHAQL